MSENPTPLPSFDPKEGIIYIKDPIHSYVYITRRSKMLDPPDTITESEIISNPWAQRLRRIRQTQAAYTVYPGLEHTRFEHVLGVMHLAGRMARKWYGQLLARLEDGGHTRELLPTKPALAYVEEVFRLAGLLHDIGHGPFSHSLDSAYKRVFKDPTVTHELISCLVIEHELGHDIQRIRRSPTGTFTDAIDPRLITWLIRPRPEEYTEKEYFWLRALRPIISGIFDADALDYISRDAYHGGLREYGSLDIDRFMEYAFLSLSPEAERVQLCFHKRGLPALHFLFVSRFKMYEACYFHRSVRAFEHRATELLARLLKKLGFPDPKRNQAEFLSRFLELDEYWLFGQTQHWKSSNDPEFVELGEAWAQFAQREHGLELVHEHPIVTRATYLADGGTGVVKKYDERLRDILKGWGLASENKLAALGFDESAVTIIQQKGESVCDEIVFDAPALDVRRGINPSTINQKVRIYDPLAPGKMLHELGLREIINELPMLFAPVRVYVRRRELEQIVRQAAQLVAAEMNAANMLQDTSF